MSSRSSLEWAAALAITLPVYKQVRDYCGDAGLRHAGNICKFVERCEIAIRLTIRNQTPRHLAADSRQLRGVPAFAAFKSIKAALRCSLRVRGARFGLRIPRVLETRCAAPATGAAIS